MYRLLRAVSRPRIKTISLGYLMLWLQLTGDSSTPTVRDPHDPRFGKKLLFYVTSDTVFPC